jgi:hypothetical protein
MSRPHFLRLALLLAFATPTAAHAAPPQLFLPNKNATSTARVILPAQIVKLYDLDFGFVTVTGAGTAILNSSTGAVSTTGGVLFAGGLPHAALFEAVSPSKTVVHIRLPKKAVTLMRSGGTETMTVDTWTLNGVDTRNVVAHETFQFQIGGTLHVAAGQVEGTYNGTFDVTIDYN